MYRLNGPGATARPESSLKRKISSPTRRLSPAPRVHLTRFPRILGPPRNGAEIVPRRSANRMLHRSPSHLPHRNLPGVQTSVERSLSGRELRRCTTHGRYHDESSLGRLCNVNDAAAVSDSGVRFIHPTPHGRSGSPPPASRARTDACGLGLFPLTRSRHHRQVASIRVFPPSDSGLNPPRARKFPSKSSGASSRKLTYKPGCTSTDVRLVPPLKTPSRLWPQPKLGRLARADQHSAISVQLLNQTGEQCV